MWQGDERYGRIFERKNINICLISLFFKDKIQKKKKIYSYFNILDKKIDFAKKNYVLGQCTYNHIQ